MCVSKRSRRMKRVDAKIILACAPPKKGKFEFIIEKCTELGVDEIIPLKTKRTEVIFKEERWPANLAVLRQWRLMPPSSLKGLKVPHIYPMTTLPQVLKGLDPNGVHLFPSLHQSP